MYCQLGKPYIINTFLTDVDFIGNSISRNALFSLLEKNISRQEEKNKCPLLNFDKKSMCEFESNGYKLRAYWNVDSIPTLEVMEHEKSIKIMFGTLISALYGSETKAAHYIANKLNKYKNIKNLYWIETPPVCESVPINKFLNSPISDKDQINKGIYLFNNVINSRLNIQRIRPKWYDFPQHCSCYTDWVHHQHLSHWTLHHVAQRFLYDNFLRPMSEFRKKNSCSEKVVTRLNPNDISKKIEIDLSLNRIHEHNYSNAKNIKRIVDKNGFALVRNFLSKSLSNELREIVERVTTNGFEKEVIDKDLFPVSKAAQLFIHHTGSALVLESPKCAKKLLDTFDRMKPFLKHYFGDDVCISSPKWTLRRTSGIKVPGWHQDGYFMNKGGRYLNMWIALDDCGEGEPLPGMTFKLSPERTFYKVDKKKFFYDKKSVPNILIDDDTVKHKENFVPHFKQGDAIFFDEYIVHSTEFRSQINENLKRHAIEMWFHPHCASENEYSEPLLW